MHVTVYRSSKKEGMYVYLSDQMSIEKLPAAVMKQLGEPERSLEFDLPPDRQLPNADTAEVLDALQSQGFYIQMPRDIESLMADVAQMTQKNLK